MRYRKLDAQGDYQTGHGSADFWVNQPEAVGQSALTRLLLYAGEWFLDTSAGTPWGGFPLNDRVVAQGKILGAHTELSRDVALKQRLLGTQGLVSITDYDSTFDPNTRRFSVRASIDTIYGRAFIGTQVPTAPIEPNVIYSIWDAGASLWDGDVSRWDRRIA